MTTNKQEVSYEDSHDGTSEYYRSVGHEISNGSRSYSEKYKEMTQVAKYSKQLENLKNKLSNHPEAESLNNSRYMNDKKFNKFGFS